MSAKPEVTLRKAAAGWRSRWGKNCCTMRMGPARFTSSPRVRSGTCCTEVCRSSLRICPALLINALSFGNRAVTCS